MDAPKVFSKYHLEDQNQKSLALEEFGLGSYYWGLNGYYPGRPSQHFAARKNPATINLFGEVQSKEGVESEVLKHLSEPGHRKIKFVDVTQTIFGARSEDSAGVSEVRKWRIYNPHL